ncbi:MAG: hypothetical protein JRD92_08280 [Deltaproteobacteria bacterium]|nr:hypothetical protein [Deltaproteobacteria bacterium]
MMVKTGEQVSSSDKAGRNFSATLEANLVAGDDVVAKAGTDAAEKPRGPIHGQPNARLHANRLEAI